MSFGFSNTSAFPSSSTPSLGFGSSTKPTFGSTATPAFGATTGSSAFGSTSGTSMFGTSGGSIFGSTSTTPAFGATSTAPTFGASAATPAFGATSATPFGTASGTPAFGASTGTSAFGATTGTPTFGATSITPTFGASSATPAFGASSATPAFGASSGTPAFGASSTTPAFGAPAATPAFGTPAATFGFGASSGTPAFGATSTTPAFGATSTAPTFNIGSGFGTFGNTGTASTGLGFGSFGTQSQSAGTTGFGNFGNFGTSTPGTGLFSGFGQSAGTGTGLTGFGTGLGAKPATTLPWGSSTFGQPQQQQQTQIDPNQALYNAVFNCHVFGDERDRTLSRWNLVQALWGTGKGYYSLQAPPVEFTMKNPLCRFKAISYSMRPKAENKDGFVALIFNKKESEIRELESQLLTNLNNILGNKPNLLPVVESIKAFSEFKTLVVIYVQEKQPSGTTKKILASDVVVYLSQPMQRQQLTSLQVENIYPQVDPGQESLKEYLDNPPAGFDARLWKQAQEDNPLSDKLIPVPLIGFADVRWRMKCQEQETALHQAFLDKMADEIADLQRRHTETLAKISEYRLKFSELQHRILKIMIIQEISRKMGLSLLPEEEKLKSRLETVSATVNSAQFKSRLAKLTEEVKSHSKSNKEPQRYKMDPDVIADIKQFLTMEQAGMTHVIGIIQTDLSDLKRMKDGMMKILQGQIQ